VQDHEELLWAIFNCYKSKNTSHYFWMDHWVTLLTQLHLIGDQTGIGITHAKLLFMWSKVSRIYGLGFATGLPLALANASPPDYQ